MPIHAPPVAFTAQPCRLATPRLQVLQEAARSIVKLESAAAKRRQALASPTPSAGASSRRVDGVDEVLTSPHEPELPRSMARGSVLMAPPEKIDEVTLLLRRYRAPLARAAGCFPTCCCRPPPITFRVLNAGCCPIE